VLYAVARHRVYAVASGLEAVVNLGLSIILFKQIGIVGVALGTTIPLLIKLVVMPLYVCRVINLKPSRYYAALAPAFAMSSTALSVFYFIVRPYLTTPGYPALLMAAIAPLLVLAVLAFLFVLGREERTFITGFMATRFGRLRGEPA
jgi:O-antigen/teichoic acid export membrane protein